MGFERLRVYQAAQQLDAEVRLLVARIPRGHADDINQLVRSDGSILFNIPEAYGAESPGKKRNHSPSRAAKPMKCEVYCTDW